MTQSNTRGLTSHLPIRPILPQKHPINGPSSMHPTGGIVARALGVSRANSANLGSPNKLEGLNPEQRHAVLKTEGGDFSKGGKKPKGGKKKSKRNSE